jgi:hypothetical protein
VFRYFDESVPLYGEARVSFSYFHLALLLGVLVFHSELLLKFPSVGVQIHRGN